MSEKNSKKTKRPENKSIAFLKNSPFIVVITALETIVQIWQAVNLVSKKIKIPNIQNSKALKNMPKQRN
jgi:hypothetical protein